MIGLLLHQKKKVLVILDTPLHVKLMTDLLAIYFPNKYGYSCKNNTFSKNVFAQQITVIDINSYDKFKEKTFDLLLSTIPIAIETLLLFQPEDNVEPHVGGGVFRLSNKSTIPWDNTSQDPFLLDSQLNNKKVDFFYLESEKKMVHTLALKTIKRNVF